ncbi:hypothetical protein [Streptomyces sp. NPDC048623]|uniref:hypothetical protein n=1 Tax=Streptomyces sp. NPDC048623 TaxID=3155761 RepID=UPI003447D2BF
MSTTERRPVRQGAGERASSRRIRRAGILGGAAAAATGGVYIFLELVTGGPLRWAAAPVAAVCFGVVVFAGFSAGREHGTRKETIAPGETVLCTYGVWAEPAPPASRRASVDFSPYQLRLTDRQLQLWQYATLVWAHPWTQVRLVTDGPLLRVLHEDREIAAVVGAASATGMPEEVRFVAGRMAARSPEGR